jgi:ABC-2 type transport system permease protein
MSRLRRDFRLRQAYGGQVGAQAGGWQRISALAWKDARELARNPGAILPPVLMVLGSLFPAFLVVIGAPMIAGRTLEESGDFAEEAARAMSRMPELAGLAGNALIQAFLFHQFALLLLMVPVVSATALATHAVIGEKQSKALEPLLATPISTLELLAAKALTPFLFALALTWIAAALYVAGVFAFGEPGVWQTALGPRTFILFAIVGPLIELATLQVSVIVSSRANDPRSAQQLTSLLILPITVVFIAQLMGGFVLQASTLLLGATGLLLLNGLLLVVGVRVFHRETILTRWK